MLKRLNKILRLILPILLFGFITFNIYQNRDLLLSFWTDFQILPLTISLLIAVIIYFEAALNYHFLIKALGFPLKIAQSAYIFIVSNASRYIPGSIWQYIGRVEMAKRIGEVPRKTSVLELILEVFLLVNSGLIVTLIALPFFSEFNKTGYLAFLLIPLSLIFIHPKIAYKLIKIVSLVTKKNTGDTLLKINFNKITLTLPWFILNFFLNGLSLFFLVKSISPNINLTDVVFFSGAFAFSWVVGYLSIFAPAGLGVTDIILVYLLSYKVPFPLASSIAISYRVLLTIAELIVFALIIRVNPTQSSANTDEIKRAWEDRSKKFGFKVEGVATKSLPPPVNERLDKWMFQNIKIALRPFLKKNEIKILDLGCGYGRLSKPLLEDFKHIKTYGVDISENYVKLYNKSLKPRGRAIEGDIKKLPFKKNYFDLVFIVTTLMYLTNIKDQEKAIGEILRVLKPGGKAVIIERNPTGYFLFTLGGLAGLIRGKSNKEINAVSIDKRILQTLVDKNSGIVESIEGIPIFSLFMPFSVIISKIRPEFVKSLGNPINKIDNKLKHFLWPSLYLSYTITKPAKG